MRVGQLGTSINVQEAKEVSKARDEWRKTVIFNRFVSST